MENKKQKNNWKIATILLGILIIGLIVYNVYNEYNENTDWEKTICNKVEGTPSWVDNKGNIVDVGYKQYIYSSESNETKRNEYYSDLKKLMNGLIISNITFVYNSKCSYCQKQINEFKEINFWEEYEMSGLTKDCAK